jgi:monovalent cation:H+ antiporter-2, CPA2 family
VRPELAAATGEQAIRELAAALPAERLPAEVGVDEVIRLALERERDVSTDLGVGVALPHARCPGLTTALVAFGRSRDGLVFTPQAPAPVHLVFLLVTPVEQPELQLTLLGRLAALSGDVAARDRLRAAASVVEVLEVIAAREKQGQRFFGRRPSWTGARPGV